MRCFRGWGGREGTCPVSSVVSVGGFVSFDSSNGAQARMWVRLRPYDKQHARDRTEKHRSTSITADATQHSKRSPATNCSVTSHFHREKGKMRREAKRRAEKKHHKRKKHILILEARNAEVHHLNKFCVARKLPLVAQRKKR